MFIPEYSITNQTIKNIANIEYSKAIVENATILPNLQRQLEKDATMRFIYYTLDMYGLNVNINFIKRYLDEIASDVTIEVENLYKGINLIKELSSQQKDFEETDLIMIHKLCSKGILPTTKIGTYRSKKIQDAFNPENILAGVVELTDWYNSLDSRESYPIITSAILRARLETIIPFEETNLFVSNLTTLLSLNSSGYTLNNYYCIEEFFSKSSDEYYKALESTEEEDPDYTLWIEYFTDALSHELTNIKEKVGLYARDTKIAKAAGKTKLTERQERLIEYMQDYGALQNKDFGLLFSDVSEDSILRDLKLLINEGLVTKSGSTKSSRYILR